MTIKPKELTNGSTFSEMIKNNCLYVDKTQHIYQLFKGEIKYYFLSRPRRFGKSLLISTLKELFAGNKKLFDGLWIEKTFLRAQDDQWEWKQHPVIHLDFSELDHDNAVELKADLVDSLDQIAQDYGVDISNHKTPGTKLKNLIRKLSTTNNVVILIDEYDKPIIDHINDLKIAEKNRAVLKSFYDVLKAQDKNLRAIFVTGVSKFSKTSLFSGINNLNDISQLPIAAALLGYTQEELELNFASYIIDMAKTLAKSGQELLDEMKQWYNGYRFSKADLRVYNPFSVLFYLNNKERNNYWIKSGTPTFLVDLLKMNYQTLRDFSGIEVEESVFDPFELTAKIPLIPLLCQTGYLTIDTVFQEFDLMGQNPVPKYRLTYPNQEVREAFLKYVLVAMTFADESSITDIIAAIKKALANNNIQDFCQQLVILFAHIPGKLHLDFEAYYHSLLRVMMLFMKIKADPEVPTDKGFIDLVIPTLNRIYVIEIKFNKSAKDALNQVKRKKYYEKYMGQGLPITLAGIDFNYKKKDLKIRSVQELL